MIITLKKGRVISSYISFIMNPQQYFSFFEKVTRKLADTFTQLNLLCQQELSNCNQSSVVEENIDNNLGDIQPEEPLIEEHAPSPIEVDSPQEEPMMKSPKTKKIKKEAVVEQEERENESIKSKKKIKKVSHKPKAPASSFLLFFKDQQPSISQAYPTYGVTDLTKVAAKLWSELDQNQKKPYIQKGDIQRKNYQIRMKKYRQDFPQEIAEKEKDRQLRKEKKGGVKDNAKKQKAQPSSPKNSVSQENKVDPKGPQISQQLKIVAEASDSESVELQEQPEDSLGIV